MHQSFFFIIVFTFLKTVFLFSQNTNQQDYIVLYTGDTLYGKVEYINKSKREFYKKIRITDANGKRKKYKRKQIFAFKKDNFNYLNFRLKQPSRSFSFESLVNTIYNINIKNGEHYFLKVIEDGNLSQYELEWFEQGEARLHIITLFKKANDNFFVRADQGIFGLKTKVLDNYFHDCPKLKLKIKDRTLKKPSEVVGFYNKNCKSY